MGERDNGEVTLWLESVNPISGSLINDCVLIAIIIDSRTQRKKYKKSDREKEVQK